jgi:hypothetical protein
MNHAPVCWHRGIDLPLVVLSLLFASCTSLPHCRAGTLPLSQLFYSQSNASTAFNNGLIMLGYHESAIAPAEILTAEADAFMAVRLRFADPVAGAGGTWLDCLLAPTSSPVVGTTALRKPPSSWSASAG